MATLMAGSAERVGFEPTETRASTVFKLVAAPHGVLVDGSKVGRNRLQTDGNTDGRYNECGGSSAGTDTIARTPSVLLDPGRAAFLFGGSSSVELLERRSATLYRYYNETGHLLYVGITGAGRHRGSAHARLAPWWYLVASAEFFHGSLRAVMLAERLAIWTERPRYNTAFRVSTERRQAMLRAVAAWSDEYDFEPIDAARILGLSEQDVRLAIRLGFMQCDFPRANRLTKEQMAAFIGEHDDSDASDIGHQHYQLTPRRRDAP